MKTLSGAMLKKTIETPRKSWEKKRIQCTKTFFRINQSKLGTWSKSGNAMPVSFQFRAIGIRPSYGKMELRSIQCNAPKAKFRIYNQTATLGWARSSVWIENLCFWSVDTDEKLLSEQTLYTLKNWGRLWQVADKFYELSQFSRGQS